MNGSLLQYGGAALIAGAGTAWAVVATSRDGVRAAGWGVRAAAAVVLTLAALAVALGGWAAGAWWFVGDKVIAYAPLAAAALIWFCIAAVRGARHPGSGSAAPPSVRASSWAGAIAAIAGLVVQLVVGFPAPPWATAGVLAAAAASIAVVAMRVHRSSRRPFGTAAAMVGTVVVVVAATASVGAAGGATPHAHAHAPASGIATNADVAAEASVDVTELRTSADRTADVRVDVEAQQQRIDLPSGRTVAAWTFGELGGPLIEADEGDLVEVTLRNRDIAEGVTAHWHGYEVPNGEDGAAGITQDAVRPGDSFTYRFVAATPGTYWYHTHQRSSAGVPRGLYGPLVVHARDAERADHDMVLPLHTFGGRVVLGDSDVPQRIAVAAGETVRVRLINTDQDAHVVAVTGTPYRVVAIDGRDVSEPGLVDGRALRIPAGGRYDVAFVMPDGAVGVSARASDSASVTFAAASADDAPAARYDEVFDPLAYGSPRGPALEAFDVERTIVLDRLPRIVAGAPAYAYTIDGEVHPHIRPTVVREGDRVRLTVVNRGFETHPMHPHGHHVVVLSVNGRVPTGGPVVLDTFEVRPGETWEVALVADNPGIWMDHCHDLDHAALGMVTHLVYRGVVTPFDHGGAAGNQPE